jgi:hypothetical protein
VHKEKTFGALKIYWYKEPVKTTVRRKLAESIKSKSNKWFQSNGPLEVIHGIQKSLSKKSKKLNTINECNWIVSSNLTELIRDWNVDELRVPVLLGPNIEFERYLPEIASLKDKYILVPALWVAPVLQSRLNVSPEQIKIWASGVDTNFWKRGKGKRKNVLIYRKNDHSDDLDITLEFLKKENIPYKVFEYGKYRQKAFKRYLNTSIGAIWLAGTESQGMALLQAWSMDVPTLVRRKDTYFDQIGSVLFAATSAPYLTPETGCFSETESLQIIDLKKFFSSISEFHPREYVMQNFTLDKKLQEALSLLPELSS